MFSYFYDTNQVGNKIRIYCWKDVVFLHNPGAFDRDGDSLSYRLSTPKQFFDREVDVYKEPIDPKFYDNFSQGNEAQDGRPTFSIDAANGNLMWDAPGAPGEYNIAFIVDEWRFISEEWFLLGSVTRDMQIIIEDTDNNPPEIIEPPELCVEAGTLINEIVTATDPDGDPVKIEGFGGPFQQESNSATLDPIPDYRASPTNVSFIWQTNCELVRNRPYEVQLKATDLPDLGPKLVDFKTWLITIVAPAPTGLAATILPQRRIQLDWDNYSCGAADKMQIWRRVESYDFTAEECVVGLPPEAGYQLIDTVGMNVATYVDENGGMGLAPGANYCYRIVAVFPEPTGGKSYASNEACQELLITAPVILEVDVEKTDQTEGQIFIGWQEPTDLDPILYPPDQFEYEIIRYKGPSGLVDPDTLQSGMVVKNYTDSGLDTESDAFHYVINAYNGGTFVDSSFPASSVWLDATASATTIKLAWSSMVPWSNVVLSHPYHLIYRDNVIDFEEEVMVLIDSVNVAGLGQKYSDDGRFNEEPLDDKITYTYFVETKGSYGNENIKSPLINKSQEIKAQPDDEIAPCPPISFRLDDNFDCEAFLSDKPCSFSAFTNQLFWESKTEDGCDDDVRSFNVYFSKDGDETVPFEFLANVTIPEYLHDIDISSFKGCYKISAVDRSGNESQLSEKVCNDNCPNYVLPNAFSPNGDNINDTFTPYTDVINNKPVPGFDFSNCPRFVQKVEFKVFDRAGGVLFDFNSARSGGEKINNVLINWDGNTNGGKILPAGTYFYGADVTFNVLDRAKSIQNYKGWVQIVK